MNVRNTAAQFGLSELKRSEVTMFQSREDFKNKWNLEPPSYNPALPNKYWAWAGGFTAKFVSFLVPDIVDGQPVLASMTLPLSYAQSVNIARGEANAEPAYSSETLPFPVEPLRPDEHLTLTFGGIIVVRNRTRFIEPVAGFEGKVLAALDAIKAKLGI